MTNSTNSGDSERTNLAPILAPIITLFIGFGAGVVFSEFIPLGKTAVIQPSGTSDPSIPRDGARGRDAGDANQLDVETREALQEAADNGDESARQLLEEADGAANEQVDHSEDPGEG